MFVLDRNPHLLKTSFLIRKIPCQVPTWKPISHEGNKTWTCCPQCSINHSQDGCSGSDGLSAFKPSLFYFICTDVCQTEGTQSRLALVLTVVHSFSSSVAWWWYVTDVRFRPGGVWCCQCRHCCRSDVFPGRGLLADWLMHLFPLSDKDNQVFCFYYVAVNKEITTHKIFKIVKYKQIVIVANINWIKTLHN